MKLMKTAEEMMQFCIDNNTGTYSNKYLRHFKVIENCLQEDEYVILCFKGYQKKDFNYGSGKSDFYAFALTDRRMIISQHNSLGSELQTVSYNDLNDIAVVDNTVVVDAAKAQPCIGISPDSVRYMRESLPGIVEEIKRKKAAKVMGVSSPADEIRKFKGLLDEGIITEEEFLRKKEQLLDEGAPSQLQGDDVVLTVNPADYRPADDRIVRIKREEVDAEKKSESKSMWKAVAGSIIAVFSFVIFVIGLAWHTYN